MEKNALGLCESCSKFLTALRTFQLMRNLKPKFWISAIFFIGQTSDFSRYSLRLKIKALANFFTL